MIWPETTMPEATLSQPSWNPLTEKLILTRLYFPLFSTMSKDSRRNKSLLGYWLCLLISPLCVCLPPLTQPSSGLLMVTVCPLTYRGFQNLCLCNETYFSKRQCFNTKSSWIAGLYDAKNGLGLLCYTGSLLLDYTILHLCLNCSLTLCEK